MGRQSSKSEAQSGKMKVRIIEFELEGSDTSLQESLKSITAALARPSVNTGSRATVRIETAKSGDIPASNSSDEFEDEVEDATVIEATPSSPRKPRKSGKIASPSLVDVRFDDVDPSFANFVSEKDPKNDTQKYLCAAYWLKMHKDVHEVSIDHMYTAFRSMNWALPANPIQPMRELAAKRDGRFSKGTEKGHYKINHIGEGHVATKMGHGQ